MGLRRTLLFQLRSTRVRAALLGLAATVAAALGWGLGSLTGGGSGSAKPAGLAAGRAQGPGTIHSSQAVIASLPSLRVRTQVSSAAPGRTQTEIVTAQTGPKETPGTTSSQVKVVTKPHSETKEIITTQE